MTLTREIGHHFEPARGSVSATAFDEGEVGEILRMCRTLQLVPGDVGGEKGYTPDAATRRSKVAFFFDSLISRWIFDRVDEIIEDLNGKFFGYDLCGYDRIQYARYEAEDKGYYDWHMDVGSLVPMARKLSASVLLSDDFDGGEFQFNFGPIIDSELTKAGRIVVFPSHVVHRVKPVTRGVRESLVIWVLGPKLR